MVGAPLGVLVAVAARVTVGVAAGGVTVGTSVFVAGFVLVGTAVPGGGTTMPVGWEVGVSDAGDVLSSVPEAAGVIEGISPTVGVLVGARVGSGA